MLLTLVACLFSPVAFAQISQNLPQNQNSVRQGRVIIVPLPKDASGGDVYPDCNKGKVCLPVASECSTRQSKVGATRFEGKTYWFSWQSNEEVLRSAKWNWFTARNYCRKRCMDLVSFEKPNEWNFIKTLMNQAGIKEIWTAGRLCDAEVNGCDAPHYQPLSINGWFWASTLVQMLPTNRTVGLNSDGVRVIGVNEWAQTGPKGLPQPDGFTPAGGLGEEPCMAVIDGKWHDTSCHNRRAIVCEDLPPHNIQFVRDNNPGVFIP
jgi:hypothetical protein